ncbi:hypothetical protein [Mesorhizobium sp.]|uniref:hypothetical protein n=1 Tax=Mesorhizobium sp. TaxID=1871066 RepID=UPI000FE4C94C|nr:hypothetical protein [Mesorhizobium sp.]RWP51076.1 MAG: hypothetical protein EOR05_03930 [Mesorhizobium sp.]
MTGKSGEGSGFNAVSVIALIAGLRARGFQISPGDALACLSLAATKMDWNRDEIAMVLRAVLVRRAGEARVFEEIFAGLFQGTVPERPSFGNADAGGYIGRGPLTPAKPTWAQYIAGGAGGVIENLQKLWRRWPRVDPRVLRNARALAGAVGAGLLITYIAQLGSCSGPLPPPPPPEELGAASIEIAIYAGIDAAIAAISLTGLALLAWRALALSKQRRQRSRMEHLGASETETTPDPPMPKTDGTVFRIGSLGGQPPDFLPAAIGTEITEMIGYRQGDPDPNRLDTRRTIAAHVRGSDPTLLVAQRRRELPMLLLLVDRNADASRWNRLAEEFHTVLQARGIIARKVVFPGTFFTRRAGSLEPGSEAIAVEAVAASPGWTVTMVFGEAHRLGRSDVDFFRRLAENGPLVFLDFRDRALWDGRHWALLAAGVTLVEATATELRDALARIFAPDRVHVRDASSARLIVGKPLLPEDDPLSMLGQEGCLWASDCALVEPISFALAERLRRRYPKLASAYPSLAFSRLEALPGAWSGPEGLYFEPEMRRQLLNRFSKRPATDRAMTIATIDQAFTEAKPEGASAATVHSYARNQVHVFSDDLDAALESILKIEAEGLLYQAPIRNFLGRLRVPAAADLPAHAIILPAEPRSAAIRRRLFAPPDMPGDTDDAGRLLERLSKPTAFDERDSYRLGDFDIAPARWSLGLPSARMRLTESGQPGEFPGIPAATIGAFFAGARYMLLAGERQGQATLELFDTLLCTRRQVSTPGDSVQVTAIATASKASVAAFGSPAGKWYLLRLDPEGSNSEPLRPEPLETGLDMSPSSGYDATRPPQVGIDPQGRYTFVALPGRHELARCAISTSGERPTVWRFPAPVASIAFVEDTIFVGLSTGAVHSLPISTAELGTSSLEQAFNVGSYPAAIAVARFSAARKNGDVDTTSVETRDILVAGREDGKLICHDGDRQLSEMYIGSVPRRVVAFVDRKAAFITPAGGRERPREAGICVAVLGRNGTFEIVGMPLADSPPMSGGSPAFTAMSLLDRPLVASDGQRRAVAIAGQSSRLAILVAGSSGSAARIEVRPLEYVLPGLLPQSGSPSEVAETPLTEDEVGTEEVSRQTSSTRELAR